MDNKAQITGKVDGTFNDAITSASRASNYIYIGDTNHTLSNLREFLSSETLMRDLAESGVARVMLEVPESMQFYAEQYQAGAIDRDEFMQAADRQRYDILNTGEITKDDMLNSFMDTMDHAKQFGMTVHFVDPGLPQPTMDDIKMLMEAVEIYNENSTDDIDLTKTDSERIKEAMIEMRDRDLVPDELQTKLEEFMTRFMGERLNDENLYDNIIEAADGQKTAIIYGARHDDLIERLESDGVPVTVIDAYGDGENFYRTNDNDNISVTTEGEPDLVFIVEDGTTFVTDHASDLQTDGLTVDDGAVPPNGYFLGLPIDPPDADNNRMDFR